MEQPDLLSKDDVAKLAGFKSRTTVRLYQKRGILPKPDVYVKSKPMWKRSTIERWNCDRNSIELVEIP